MFDDDNFGGGGGGGGGKSSEVNAFSEGANLSLLFGVVVLSSGCGGWSARPPLRLFRRCSMRIDVVDSSRSGDCFCVRFSNMVGSSTNSSNDGMECSI